MIASNDEQRAVADWRARLWQQRRHNVTFKCSQDSTFFNFQLHGLPELVSQTLFASDTGAMACPITVTKFVGTVSLGLLTVSTKKKALGRDNIS